jgi:myo-inositol-1-phosphate synthase
MKAPTIHPPAARLGILFAGLGAVATTTIAGIIMGRLHPGMALIGSLTEMQRIRLGTGPDRRNPLIKELLPLAPLDSMVFGAWDPIGDSAYEAALRAGVLSDLHLESVQPDLDQIEPMSAVFSSDWVRRLASEANNVKPASAGRDTGMAIVDALCSDIERFRVAHGNCPVVVVWTGSTESHSLSYPERDGDLVALRHEFETKQAGGPLAHTPPSMFYAYAAALCGAPFINASPNLCMDTVAMLEASLVLNAPVAGKDLKTGQTLMKTVLAPALKARSLGLAGWFSTNILGNRDGQVLDDPAAFRTKEESKLGVLQSILDPDMYPELYEDAYHKVRIEYYPPRGDAKEGWDNIDLVGWLGYPMQLKVNFLCRDSILAAPLVLDLIRLIDLARRANLAGVQEWLSFYFKSPVVYPGGIAEHDLFIQHRKLKNFLRMLAGHAPLTHAEEG